MKSIQKIKWRYLTVLLLGILIGVYFAMAWQDSKVQAKVVNLHSRGLDYQVVTKASDVLGMLTEQGLTVESARVSPDFEEGIVNGMKIDYLSPIEIYVTDEQDRFTVLSSAKNVGEVLLEKGIEIFPLDEIVPSKETLTYSRMEVKVIRIEEGEIVENEQIQYETMLQGDPEELYGSEKIVQQGVVGSEDVTYKVRYKNGEEIYRKKISSVTVVPEKPEIIRVGRKIVVESYEKGRASWYSYQQCMCAAHPFFPKGSYLRVTAENSGKSVIVRVNDWGPNQSVHPDRLIDLDAEAFKLLAPLGAGAIAVQVEKLKTE